MKILGVLMIGFGLLLCLSIIFLPWGMLAIGAGALLIIASALVRRQKAQEDLAREEIEARRYQRERGAPADPEPAGPRSISNSAFGR